MNRLTPAKVTMLMLLVMGGLIVAYIAKNLLASPKVAAGPATRNVPMPLADLPEGTLITTAHIGTGPVLESDLQRDVLLSMNSILGRITRTKLTAATPIRSSMLYAPGETPALQVTAGHEAVTIIVEGPGALMSGLIKPNELVDVHFTPVVENLNRKTTRGGFTMTLIKGIKILAINGKVQQARIESDRNTVTLDATTAQANILLQAQEHGKLTLLSNTTGKGDTEIALKDEDRAYFDEILGLAPEKVEEPKKPEPPFISQAYTGKQKGTLYFRDGRRIEGYDETNPMLQNPMYNATPTPNDEPSGADPRPIDDRRPGDPSASRGNPRGGMAGMAGQTGGMGLGQAGPGGGRMGYRPGQPVQPRTR